MARLSTADFIAKARVKHGDKYDYSKTVYINQTTDVIIICPEHGEFKQRPNNHYMGAGCPICSGNKKSNTVDFIAKAQGVHGNKYDYTKTDYINSKSKVIIICPEHGEFLQTPDKHLQGQGCPECSNANLEATNLNRYGVKRPLQNKEIHDKCEETNLARYNAVNPMMSEEVQEKSRMTCREHYGVDYAQQNDSIKMQRFCTNMQRYGGHSPFCSKQIREKASDAIYKKYGIKNIMHIPDTVKKVNHSKYINNSFHVSKPEESLYEMLCNYFGESDVKRQYSSVLYPFACDFYITSRDLYIELNASWTHGKHWFDGNNTDDINVLTEWKNKNTDYYNNAVSVWSVKDLNKRETARRNNLNYIVFWDNELRDAIVWFLFNAPSGHDYDKTYSWFSERNIAENIQIPEFTGTSSNISLVAKAYQFKIFYEYEINAWHENKSYNNLPLQIFIYYNRYLYTQKIPAELSDLALMRGFTISGLHKGYTVFDTKLMSDIIDKYNIKSVFDPCAGWGERLLCCYNHNVAYFGVDINKKLESGHSAMIHDFGMQNQQVTYIDSALYDVKNRSDAVITCPPYFNIEKYSDDGAENLDYELFLEWWKNIGKKAADADIRYFCFQINQKYKDDMLAAIESNGYVLIDEMIFGNNKSSHFTRSDNKNLKQEYETMLVLEKNINNIKSLRAKIGMTQREFAEYFDITLRTVQSWEQNQRNTPAYIIKAFEKILKYEDKI